ncbi:hypothetical protein FSB73_05530 [Arachidicoccus ginsenosidivorans]|uniref:Uncharacterized protein n=1 Tax=Arachidicoccus ginsenosidivorans TaxID=496057 RepID=A0A5B8VIT7_9BACT|nr:hypothetical protein [Arachidicoccus ginsenosidivorans]QEC71219.1 hypothetical protein FSB73_05530 [Arachidicoccus ginsenosidivorans]
MKKILFLTALVLVVCTAFAQSSLQKYKRSSLWTLMIDKPAESQDSVILKAFASYPVPEKFNDHNGDLRVISALNAIDENLLSQYANGPQSNAGLGLLGKNPKSNKKQQSSAGQNVELIEWYLNDSNFAKKIVAKWFNRSAKGGFNMNLVADRGAYNASDIDVKVAKKSERGLALVRDAGEQLIQNTFVIVNDFKFTNKEEVAKKAKGLLSLASSVASYAGNSSLSLASEGASLGVGVVGKGYVIKTNAYLFKLVWNQEVANAFYNEMWTDDAHLDPVKVAAFENTDLFKLEYIGLETAWADLQSTAFTKKTDSALISIATKKATDAVIAKLQRKYEVFRTKTPLLSGWPISAKIGLKEGLEGGDKYEVLEQIQDENGRTQYKRVGVVKVEKGEIWDNRYMADEENPSKLEYTSFKGAKNKYAEGMLIRQID